jgi:signal transduction histidine kinase
MSLKDLLLYLQFTIGTPQEEDMKLLSNSDFVRRLIDSIPDTLLIINEDRQAIFANMRLLDFIGINDYRQVMGKLPGELLRCNHAISPDTKGCGETDSCEYCGLFNSARDALIGKMAQGECRILTLDNEAIDLKVWTIPLELENKRYSIITLQDNSSTKRQEVLERVFFHDIMNSAGGIFGLSQILKESLEGSESGEISDMIYTATQNLIEEIQSQRQLKNAENNTLELNVKEIDSVEILNDIIKLYNSHPVAKNKLIETGISTENAKVKTDPVLVRRVIGNMTKNALEASKPGDKITLKSTISGNGVVFSVNNPGVIPEDIKLQIFKRSFSTKGTGRGIGTYSMKLFGEKYLKGKIKVESNNWAGTTFYLELPASIVDQVIENQSEG